ncbi:Ig-like domain-containing protein [Cellulosilyticum ruminicola]|uniref:Ig-like domain-containing protein n=1 Tax=Cellulosilyticum ruminicola TaxID=425254 RepID=UPI0006CF53F1|nr:Ig-like domain-containing protein [Cellulosilyticum ruminicola]
MSTDTLTGVQTAPFSILTVDTIADLVALPNLTLGTMIKVNGYYTAIDGATHYRVVANKDNGTGIAYNNLYLNIAYSNELYSTWFGCKQDGVTDDTIYFQKFLNNFGKANLIVPPGIIKTSQMLILKGIFRNQPGNIGNVSFREITFRGAAIHYTGPENGCSMFICFHFNSIIDGLTIYDQSTANFVNVCATWNSDIRNFHVSNLFINENNADVPVLHADGGVYYQFNMSFTRGDITKALKITSTVQNTAKRTWLINSMFFTNIVIGSENTNITPYCIKLYGGQGLENVNFDNCDISYATKALFYIDVPFPNATINIRSSYLDSGVPLVEDFNYKNIIFNLQDNYEASNDSRQLMGIKLANITRSSHTGNKGIEANYLPLTVINLAMNGNLGLNVRNPKWCFDDGASLSFEENTLNTLCGNSLKCIFNSMHRGIQFLSMPLPATGTYTFGIRLKKLSGTGTLQLIYNNSYFKNFEMHNIPDGEEVLLSTYGVAQKVLSEGTIMKNALYRYGDTTDLTVEIYEIIVVAGTYISWNLPLHPMASLVSTSTQTANLDNYYNKSEVNDLLKNLQSKESTPLTLDNYYTKQEVFELMTNFLNPTRFVLQHYIASSTTTTVAIPALKDAFCLQVLCKNLTLIRGTDYTINSTALTLELNFTLQPNESLYYILYYLNGPKKTITSITLSQEVQECYIGDTFTLRASTTPESTDATLFTWASSNPNIATVTNGHVKALSIGTVQITVSYENLSASCTVTISCPQIPTDLIEKLPKDTMIMLDARYNIDITSNTWQSVIGNYTAQIRGAYTYTNGKIALNNLTGTTNGIYLTIPDLPTGHYPFGIYLKARTLACTNYHLINIGSDYTTSGASLFLMTWASRARVGVNGAKYWSNMTVNNMYFELLYTFDGVSSMPKLYMVSNSAISEVSFSYTVENMAAFMNVLNTTGIVLGGDNTAETSCKLYEIERFAFVKRYCTREDLQSFMQYSQ